MSARLVLTCILATGWLVLDGEDAQASAWCANTRNGSTICAYSTSEQCRAAISGLGGYCAPNPWQETKSRAAPPKDRATAERPRSKEKPSAKRQSRPDAVTSERSVPSSSAAPARIAAPSPTPPTSPVVTSPPQQSASRALTPQEPARPASATSFEAVRRLVLEGKYDAGISGLRALGYDDPPDVAAYIGMANHGLKRATEARRWFELALAANPENLTALAGYGTLFAEEGDLARARSNLEQIKRLCGPGCTEYSELDQAIARGRR